MVSAYDLAQWVTVTLTGRTEADLNELKTEVVFTSEERSFILDLPIHDSHAQQVIQEAPASEMVHLSCKDIGHLLTAMSSSLEHSRGNTEDLLADLTTKLIQRVEEMVSN